MMSKPSVIVETTITKRISGSVLGFNISQVKERYYLLEDGYGNSIDNLELDDLENLHALLSDFIKLVKENE